MAPHQRFERDYQTKFLHAWKKDWRSERARDLVIDLSHLQDSLAGPVSSIKNKGGCQYVYDRDDQNFRGVDTPSDLTQRLREWYQHALEKIDGFEPKTEDEVADQREMYTTQEELWGVVELALDIEQSRWAREA